MKKKLLALMISMLLLLSLAACGGSAGGSDSAASSAPQATVNTSAAADSAYAGMEMNGWEMPAAEPEEVLMDSGAAAASGAAYKGGPPSEAKIIYTADLELESKEFDEAWQALTAAVTEMNGYFESRSISQGGRYRHMYGTVRVPVENYQAFLDRAGEAAHVTNRSEYSEDVSEVYYDNEARLTTQRTKLARLQELLGQAEDMADIITIESAISETELEIEYLTGSLRKYDSLIHYSTVNFHLYEVYRLSTDEDAPLTFGQRFTSAFLAGFQNGLAALDDLTITIARNWLTLLILAAIIIAAVTAVRRRRRKRAAAGAVFVPPAAPKEDRTDIEEGKTESRD